MYTHFVAIENKMCDGPAALTDKTARSAVSVNMERSQVPNYVMSTLCRICAEKSSKLTPIFGNELLPVKIHKCLPIQVKESDCLPLKVCEACFLKLNESYMFYVKADEADQRLKKLWKILLKETMGGYSEATQLEQKVVPTSSSEAFSHMREEIQGKMSPADLVINTPEEVTYSSVEVLRNDNDDHLVDGGSNEVMVFSKAIAFEVVNETLVLNSSDKIQNDGSQSKILPLEEETDRGNRKKVSNNDQPEQSVTLFQCQFCPFQISSLPNFKIHESTHSEERPFLCDICGKSFKTSKNLRNHSKTHLSIRKKYICKICNKGFLTKFFLQEHMNSHTGETPYKCPMCEKEFREKVHLRQHKWTHSSEKFVCPICGSTFNRKGNMTEHIKQYHKNRSMVKSKARKKEKEDQQETQINLKCSFCDSEFPSQLLLKNHLKTHPEQKRFSCSICGSKFSHSGSLTYHRRVAHTGEKPYQCNYCDKKFSLRSVQIIHERKIHTFEHPYKCTFCSRPFTNSSSLRNHLLVHTKDKMFKCDECGKKFSRNSNLFVHKKLHSGDRKFSCDQCGKSYIQKHDLLKHKKVHDPKSKPFFCKYCGNSFSHKKDSSKHAMCQFDFHRKSNSDIYSAEKILDSVANTLERAETHFFIEEQQQLILESVEDFAGDKISIIYGDSG